MVLLVAPLAAFSAVFLWDGGPGSVASVLPANEAERPSGGTLVTAHFPRCGGGARVTCIVDGDTVWYRGEKIRIADIDTPETSRPGCARERRMGNARPTGCRRC